MEAKAYLRNLRMSPKKVRLVAGAVRGKTVKEAERVLRFTPKYAARPLLKLLHSAVANARHNAQVAEDAALQLRIARLLVDKGTVMKRFMPRAHGRAAMIRKPFCHITLVLSDEYPKKKNTATNTAKKQTEIKKQVDKQAHN